MNFESDDYLEAQHHPKEELIQLAGQEEDGGGVSDPKLRGKSSNKDLDEGENRESGYSIEGEDRAQLDPGFPPAEKAVGKPMRRGVGKKSGRVKKRPRSKIKKNMKAWQERGVDKAVRPSMKQQIVRKIEDNIYGKKRRKKLRKKNLTKNPVKINLSSSFF